MCGCVGACPHGRPSSKGSDSVSVSVSVSDVWFVNARSPPAPACLLSPRQSPKHTVSSGARKDMALPRTPQATKCCTRAAWRFITGSTLRTQTLSLRCSAILPTSDALRTWRAAAAEAVLAGRRAPRWARICVAWGRDCSQPSGLRCARVHPRRCAGFTVGDKSDVPADDCRGQGKQRGIGF